MTERRFPPPCSHTDLRFSILYFSTRNLQGLNRVIELDDFLLRLRQQPLLIRTYAFCGAESHAPIYVNVLPELPSAMVAPH